MTDTKHQAELNQVSAQTDSPSKRARDGPKLGGVCSHVEGGSSSASVAVELLRQVCPLVSEEPEAILGLISRLNDIHALGLLEDKLFIVRVLPLVSGGVLRFFGDALRHGKSWEQCKADLLQQFSPHFVRERMIRDHIVFKFHQKGQSLREFDGIIATADVLQYAASEQQLVDRTVMNLDPSVLSHAAFLERPRSRGELVSTVGLIEEKDSMQRERERSEKAVPGASDGDTRRRSQSRSDSANSRDVRCWDCGRSGHTRRNCWRRANNPGNEQAPGCRLGPGREH